MVYNLAFPYFPEEDIEEILVKFRHILSGQGMLTMGENVRNFEKQFAQATGAKYAIVTNSCTSALEISLRAIGVGQGDEVIVPVQTFIATGSCVAIINQARVVFCEVDNNFLLDFEDLKSKISERTKAVIIVHFAGLIHPDIMQIREYLHSKNIILIEDAAHAHGAKIGEISSGNIGDFGCFSFYSTKIMTTGEGGMLTTNDDKLALLTNSIRNRGLDVEAGQEIFLNIGSNRRMSELQAILGLYQLKRLEEFVATRNKAAQIFRDVLKPLEQEGILGFQYYPDTIRHAYWRFVIFLKTSGFDRENLRTILLEKGIKIDFPYDPLLHLQPVFRNLYGIKDGFLPRSEALARTHFCLPMHALIKENDAQYIAEELIKAIKQ